MPPLTFLRLNTRTHHGLRTHVRFEGVRATLCLLIVNENFSLSLSKEALYLPTFCHLLIVNKLFSLSLSLSLDPERQEAVSPGRGVVLTDLQSSIDCQ